MIWLYILLAVLFIILLVLLLPVHVIIRYDKKLTVKIKFFGFSFTVYSSQNEDDEEDLEQEVDSGVKKGESFISKLIKKRGILGAVGALAKILKEIGKSAVKILKRIKINRLDIDLQIASEDAATTAITYGQASAAVYSAVGILTALKMPKSYSVNVAPDFLKNKPYGTFYLDVNANIFRILYIFLALAKKYAEII